MKTALFLLALTLPASAADYAVILNEEEKKALIALLDAAVRANGLSSAGNAAWLAQKINAAGVVTEQKQAPTEEPPK